MKWKQLPKKNWKRILLKLLGTSIIITLKRQFVINFLVKWQIKFILNKNESECKLIHLILFTKRIIFSISPLNVVVLSKKKNVFSFLIKIRLRPKLLSMCLLSYVLFKFCVYLLFTSSFLDNNIFLVFCCCFF